MRKQRVLVIGEEAFNFGKLRALPQAEAVAFEGLFRFDEVQSRGAYPLPELYTRAVARLEREHPRPDGVMGYWDFPVTSLASLLCRRYGWCGPSVEAVLKCEHKYWSRLEQQRAVPEMTPAFQVFDPFDPDVASKLRLSGPLWVKPIKSHSSQLGFRVSSRYELEQALRHIRAGIDRFAEPFRFVLERARLPEEVASIDGRHCLAEQVIGGEQCTAEGFVFQGDTQVYAIVDSVRYPGRPSFARYQYPSRLPAGVQRRIATSCARIMDQIGYEQGSFNIEFFWDQARDRLWILEINPRLSQSHADITEKVDGMPNLQVMVELCLGRRPERWQGQGRFRCAAKCFLRSFEDGLVQRVPSAQDLESLQQQIPGVHVQVVAELGRRLSELQNQDSYSYQLAVVYLGGASEAELLEKLERCRRALRFELAA